MSMAFDCSHTRDVDGENEVRPFAADLRDEVVPSAYPLPLHKDIGGFHGLPSVLPTDPLVEEGLEGGRNRDASRSSLRDIHLSQRLALAPQASRCPRRYQSPSTLKNTRSLMTFPGSTQSKDPFGRTERMPSPTPANSRAAPSSTTSFNSGRRMPF